MWTNALDQRALSYRSPDDIQYQREIFSVLMQHISFNVAHGHDKLSFYFLQECCSESARCDTYRRWIFPTKHWCRFQVWFWLKWPSSTIRQLMGFFLRKLQKYWCFYITFQFELSPFPKTSDADTWLLKVVEITKQMFVMSTTKW